MKRKLFLVVFTLCAALSVQAQFQKGKIYTSAGLTGLDLSYNGMSDFSANVEGQAGYLVMDNVMLLGNVGYKHVGGDDPTPDVFSIGAGGRYYILQNGIYLGAGVKYKHANHNYNDVMPSVEIGYAFFLNRTVTIEPAIFYEQSFTDHSKYSNVGLRLGFGIYFER